MTGEITNRRTLIDIIAEDVNLVLQGSASINEAGQVRDFNASVRQGNDHIGHVNYNEVDGNVSKSIHCPSDNEADVQALLNGAVALIKTQNQES